MSGNDPPQPQTVPKIKLFIPLKRKEGPKQEGKREEQKTEKSLQPSVIINLELPKTSLERCLDKATQFTYQQLEVFYELLPRMTDIERKNNLVVLAQSAGRLWGEIKCLHTSLKDDLPILERALKGIEFCKREAAGLEKAISEFSYQNVAMSGCCLRKFPLTLLSKVFACETFGFSYDIHKFSTSFPEYMDEMFKFFIAKEAPNLLKILGGGRVVSLRDDQVQVLMLDEFLLEFTVIPSNVSRLEDGQSLYEWFLVKASTKESPNGIKVGNSLTGMLQSRPISGLINDLKIYRNFCFIQQLYRQFNEAKKNLDLTVESGPGTLKAVLWPQSKGQTFELRINTSKGGLEMKNISDESVRMNPSTRLVETLIDNAVECRFAKFIKQVEAFFGKQSNFVIERNLFTLVVANFEIRVEFWVDRRSGLVKNNCAPSSDDLNSLLDFFNRKMLEREKMRLSLNYKLVNLFSSELRKWQLSDSLNIFVDQRDDASVYLSLCIFSIAQIKKYSLCVVQKDQMDIPRFVHKHDLPTVTAKDDYNFGEIFSQRQGILV